MNRKLFFFFIAIILSSCTHKPAGIKPQATVPDDCNGLIPGFKADIQPIFKTSCAKAGCHDGTSMPLDFSQYSQIKPLLDDSEVYYYVIADRKMPEDGPLDSTQYHLVKCWLKNGYPNN